MARRIAVAATAPFGADVLERLAARHDVALLLTRPDTPRGRGRKLAAPPAKEAAERLGIPVAQPARLDGTVELGADTVVVCAYGLLVPDSLLDRALWLNVHPSLLPRWRGAAPVERATTITLAGRDENGTEVEYELEDIHARVAQHENDHLDGVLIIDRTTPEARREALAALRPRIVLG